MAENEEIYNERQYLGRNRHMLFIRLILAAFCFAAYYWSRNRELSGGLFLVLGVAILSFSSILTFIIHFRTKIVNNSLELLMWFAIRKVKIPLKNIEDIEIVKYDRFRINNPVFNLHLKGRIHFYTTGNLVVRITDKDGLIYLIGSQNPEHLKDTLLEEMGKISD
ncbi:MAG: hypothetical protein IH946_11075 [Bacteroidetes bacterium]|nr:hypothetical protein [Bacteroidota bacterium]